MMGCYPACPGSADYVLTSPVFDRVTIHLDKKYYPKGDLVITSRRDDPEAIYIQDVRVGGKEWKGYAISHQDLVKAGTLDYSLSSEPKK